MSHWAALTMRAYKPTQMDLENAVKRYRLWLVLSLAVNVGLIAWSVI